MPKMQVLADDQDPDEEGFVAMTAGQAQKFRQESPILSPWSVVVRQFLVGVTS